MADRSVVQTAQDADELADAAVSPDALFDVLAVEQRRLALSFLLDRRDRVSVDALADHVATRMAGPDGRAPTHATVVTRLHHVDLPKMTDAGVVVYHRDEGTVTPTDLLDDVAPLLPVDD